MVSLSRRVLSALLAALATSLLLLAWPAAAAQNAYFHLRLSGVINPPKAHWLARTLERAERENAALVVISLDTPGGLVTSTQEICSSMTNSRVPVVVFVEPKSAQATSAGAFILLASDVAAMAPGTRVGAAHPVGSGEKLDQVMDQKATNSLASLARSLAERRGRPIAWAEAMVRESKSHTEAEALAVKGIDLVASDVDDLVRRLDGQRIAQDSRTLMTRDLARVPLTMPWHWRLLDLLADPTLAALLLSLGVMGIFYELSTPGIGMGGIVGVICVVLGLAGASVLPLAWGGIALLIVGLTAIAVEIKAQTHGMLAAGGVVALVLGAMLLIDPGDYYGAIQRVDWRVFAPTVTILSAALVLLARAARRALGRPPLSGVEALRGKRGRAKVAFVPATQGFVGSVFVDGARWQAVAESAIDSGDEIEVVAVVSNPTRLQVAPAKAQR